LIVISLLRAHIFSADSHTTGWLRGMQDPSVARVLSTIHAHPQRAWTVSKLASAGNMSRSAFSERFSRLTGFSPIQYLNQWRIGLAADRLRTTRQSMDTIAQAVGYQSDRAFRRAFRQQFGMSPLQYRKQFREQES
jgi:transcriptional regulator GlxA family with amidase domain